MARSSTPTTPSTGSQLVAPDFQSHLPAVVGAAYVLAPIIEQRIAAIQQVAQQKQLPVHHSFNAPLFAGTVDIPSSDRIWKLMPLAEDPAYNHRHGFPMPREVINSLKRIRAAGIEFDTLYIAHETQMGGYYLPSGEASTDLLPPPSAKAVQLSANLGSAAANLVKLAFAPVLAAGMVGTAALGAAMVAGTLIDPIVFGVVTAPDFSLRPGAPAAWCYVAHWYW